MPDFFNLLIEATGKVQEERNQMRLLQPCGTIIGVSGPPSQTSVSSCLSSDELGIGVAGALRQG